MIRTIFIPLLLFGTTSILFGQDIWTNRYDFSVENRTIVESLYELGEITGVAINFSSNFFSESDRISRSFQQERLDQILTSLLAGTSIRYRDLNGQIVLFRDISPPKKFTISGFIEDAQTGERLIAATIFDPKSGQGAVSNNYGYFSILLEEGPCVLQCSYLGYQIERIALSLDSNKKINISLDPSLTLSEVVVVAKDSLLSEYQLADGEADLPIVFFDQLPALGGEGDILRFTHSLAGVQTGADGVGGIHVRGGGADQNLILLDGVPVYNATHALGLFSIFNSSAVRRATLHKGNFPARYSGRLSSILDIRTKEGNQKSISGSVQAGLIGGRFMLEGPIVKDKGAFLVAGRLAYLNFWLQPYLRRQKEERGLQGTNDYGFYDLNAKFNYALTEKDKVYISLYRGGDSYLDNSFQSDTVAIEANTFNYEDTFEQSVSWGNTIGALRWNRVWGPKLFSNLALTYSNYDLFFSDKIFLSDFDLNQGILLNEEGSLQQFQSRIQDWGVMADIEYIVDPNYKILLGATATRHQFRPGVLTFFDVREFEDIDTDTIFSNSANVSLEFGVYAENQIQLNPFWSLNIGFHVSQLSVEEKNYFRLQPRLALYGKITQNINFYLAGGRMIQALHLLTSSDFSLPTDLWLPSTAAVQPEEAWQADLGFSTDLGKKLRFSISSYYKTMDHMLSFQEGTSLSFIDATNWESMTTSGQGEAYGIEVELRKIVGKTQYALNYSLAKATRQFDEINNGKVYPFKYDRRHNVKAMIRHQWNEKIDISASWTYTTGLAFTIPTSAWEFVQLPNFITYDILQVGEKNSLRLPAYQRLDLGLRMKWEQKWGGHILNLGVYNIYDYSNPLYYRIIRDPDNIFRKKFVQVSIMPLFPIFSYTLKFY